MTLGKLPHQLIRDHPQKQILLALAALELDAEDATRTLRREMTTARTPAKWRKIHGNLDRAARAMGHLN